jgi:hypothetical protein
MGPLAATVPFQADNSLRMADLAGIMYIPQWVSTQPLLVIAL